MQVACANAVEPSVKPVLLSDRESVSVGESAGSNRLGARYSRHRLREKWESSITVFLYYYSGITSEPLELSIRNLVDLREHQSDVH